MPASTPDRDARASAKGTDPAAQEAVACPSPGDDEDSAFMDAARRYDGPVDAREFLERLKRLALVGRAPCKAAREPPADEV